jgi:hypothetical protein
VSGDVAISGYDAAGFDTAPDTNRAGFAAALATFLGPAVTAANIEVIEVGDAPSAVVELADASLKLSFAVFRLQAGPSGEPGSDLVLANLSAVNATLFAEALRDSGLTDTTSASVVEGTPSAAPLVPLECCGKGDRVYGSCVCSEGAFGPDCSLQLAPLPPKQTSRRVVKDFTYLTFELRRVPGMFATTLSNLAGDPDLPVKVYAAQQNFLEVAFDQYYMPTEVDTEDIGYRGSGGGTLKGADGALNGLEYENTRTVGRPDVLDSLYRHGNVTSGSRKVADPSTGESRAWIPPPAVLGGAGQEPFNASDWDPSAEASNGVEDPEEEGLHCYFNDGAGSAGEKGAFKQCGPADVAAETQEYVYFRLRIPPQND